MKYSLRPYLSDRAQAQNGSRRPPSRRRKGASRRVATIGVAVVILFVSRLTYALPSNARDTGMSCVICHTEFPILTDYGRQFKLDGYTENAGENKFPPFAVMLLPSFTRTNKDQAGGAAPHFGPNNNLALTQASLFYGGRLFGPYAETLFGPSAAGFLNKFGAFIQTTYDGVARQYHWDNAEIRFADTIKNSPIPLSYGIYLNNNPGMQDLWNSTPVWGYPFSKSGLAPTPAVGTLLEGGLAQQVLGVGGYMMLSHSIYLDLAGYHTISTRFQRAMGISPDGETQVPGMAPYWRVAYTKSSGNQSFEAGVFGIEADTYPGRDRSAGKDDIVDLGIDGQYQVAFAHSDLALFFSAIHEWDDWKASRRLGIASNSSDHLWSVRATVDYLYDQTYGGAVSYFHVDGNNDSSLYSGNGTASPLSDGVALQVNYLPFNKSGGPSFWPRSNLKLSLQYVIYSHFNGSHRGASDNNTLYLESWLAF